MKVELIAEIGSVHDGSFGNALKLIELSAECGADIVKFQTHIAEAETLPDAPMPAYFKGEKRLEYFKRTAFSTDQWVGLKRKSEECGLGFLSSPFSLEAVDVLEKIGIHGYKIPSGEVTNIPLLKKVRRTGKPVILSSGMSSWQELDEAVNVLQDIDLTVMQCASAYPCPPERIGLNVIGEMKARYGVPVGFSDHTRGNAAAIAAVALGATQVEKHLTFSRKMYGSDAANAAEPEQFKALAADLSEISEAMTHPVDKDDLRPYAEMKKVFEKSIVTARALGAGTVLSEEDLAFKKPGDGIGANRVGEVVGRKIVKDLPENHKLCESDFK